MVTQRERLAILETKLESIDRRLENLHEDFKAHNDMEHEHLDRANERLLHIEKTLVRLETSHKVVNTQGLGSVIGGIFAIMFTYFKGKLGGIF